MVHSWVAGYFPLVNTVDGLRADLAIAAGALDWLNDFDATQVATLRSAVARAASHQEQAIDAALDGVVRFVPRLLRGQVTRLLFPGGRRG